MVGRDTKAETEAMLSRDTYSGLVPRRPPISEWGRLRVPSDVVLVHRVVAAVSPVSVLHVAVLA